MEMIIARRRKFHLGRNRDKKPGRKMPRPLTSFCG
jgi:hypothetical protein